MDTESLPGVAVVGGGPAGLMAAEAAMAAGVQVDLYESRGSVGRKFLIAGKGGLNLTHSEPLAQFVARYGPREADARRWLTGFDADAIRRWAGALGINTFVGSSGRVFPADMKAAPLLRAWVRRLRESGVRFHVHHRCSGWDESGALQMVSPARQFRILAGSTVLALGGASWPQLGSDGAWVPWLGGRGVDIAPLMPSNCGFDLAWSDHFASRFAGQPVKPAWLTLVGADGQRQRYQGEFVITGHGIEGSLVYRLSAALRDQIARNGEAALELDLAPTRDESRLAKDLARPRNRRSTSEFIRRNAGISGVQAGLLFECAPWASLNDVDSLVHAIKHLPLKLLRARPIAEAISSAGGVRLEAMDQSLMLKMRPGVFCAGEMLDWEAPTGGYLLAASIATGRIAGAAAAAWVLAGR